jgi:hypothetical protein
MAIAVVMAALEVVLVVVGTSTTVQMVAIVVADGAPVEVGSPMANRTTTKLAQSTATLMAAAAAAAAAAAVAVTAVMRMVGTNRASDA